MKKFDDIVIGGGMVGLAFAIDLSQKKNCSIAIVEPNNINPSIRKTFHTRVSAITPSSEAYLKSLNIWEDIQRKQVFVTTKVWDQNSHGRLNFHAKDENMDHLGYIVENDLIQSALFSCIDKNKIVYKHALKNAASPIITILALSLSGSLGGAIITEAVFDWPGMGRLYFEAISVMDLPVIIGATYVLTVLFLISIFVADLLYGYFDPRVKTE